MGWNREREEDTWETNSKRGYKGRGTTHSKGGGCRGGKETWKGEDTGGKIGGGDGSDRRKERAQWRRRTQRKARFVGERGRG